MLLPSFSAKCLLQHVNLRMSRWEQCHKAPHLCCYGSFCVENNYLPVCSLGMDHGTEAKFQRRMSLCVTDMLCKVLFPVCEANNVYFY